MAEAWLHLEEAVAKAKQDPLDRMLSQCRKYKAYSGRFGVEIELEGDNLGAAHVENWLPKHDGSLREGGMEFILAQPMNIPALSKATHELAAALRHKDIVVRLSPRASTHIHLNVQKETLRTILYYVGVFSIIEPVMCKLAGAMRDGNLFCLPASDSGNLAASIEVMTAHATAGSIDNFPQRGKYAALNLNTLTSFGSVEHRMFPPTATAEDIITWCRWIENILEIAKKTVNDRDLREHINLGRSNPTEIIEKVFGEINLPLNEAGALVQFGCETAYEVYRAIRFGRSEAVQAKYVGARNKAIFAPGGF